MAVPDPDLLIATNLIETLRAAGIVLGVQGGKILIKPASRLNEDDRMAIRANRDAIIPVLQREQDERDAEEVDSVARVYWRWIA